MATFALLALLLGAQPRPDELPVAARKVAGELSAALEATADGRAVRRLAVTPFADPGPARGSGVPAAEAVAAELARVGRAAVLEPSRLSALLGEARFKAMVGGAPADEADFARQAGVQAVVRGQFSDEGDRLRLVVRVVSATGARELARSEAVVALGQGPRAAAPPAAPAGGSKAVESGHVDVAIRKLADGLAGGFSKMPGSASYRRLAVLAFSEDGDQAKKRKLGPVVTAELTTRLRRDHGLLLVERQKLGQVLGELKLQEMTGLSARQAADIGAMADVQALVLGSVADAGDRYLVNARIVAAQSGDTLSAESVAVPAAGMVALASDAVVLRSRSDAVFRSLLLPGWGQLYNRQPRKAWLFAGGEVVLVGAAVGYHLAGRKAYDDYLARDRADQLGGSPSQRAQELYDTAASRYRTRNWLVAGAVALWAVNVGDAWLSGVDGASMVDAGVVAAPLPGGGAVVVAAGAF
jgi:TolB-like protein